VRIAGLGHYLPKRVMTNAELERTVETSDQWIQDRTGIRERRIAENHETASSLGLEAGKMALDGSGIDPATIDLVLVGTTTPDGLFPSTASLIQDKIGARRAGGWDCAAACAGFLSAFATGMQFIQTGASKRVLVVGTEVLSRIMNWQDRGTCVLFGDGAGAVLLEAAEFGGPLGLVMRSDGSKKYHLWAEGIGAARDAEGNGPTPEQCMINMDGPAMFKSAVHAMTDSVREAVSQAGLTMDDIDLFVPHQANLRIMQGTAKALGIPPEKVVVTVDKYGNNSSATIPIALSEAYQDGRLEEGMRIAMCTIGGGLAWGAMVLEYSRTGVAPAARRPTLATAERGRA
jgi:3-oxoacyl-[acyl-carrier-protein] synthase-3